MNLDGYIRVSRVGGREGESFISPDVQRKQIESYAEANGFTIARWHEDFDQSGGGLERPAFQAALERCRSGETGGIVAAKLDRISRSIVGLAHVIEEAKAGGWRLVAVDFGLDVKKPAGKLVADILGAVAEWELERQRQGWDTAQERAVARGVHVASRAPTGYRRNEDGRLELIEEWAPHIHELFVRRAAGTSWSELGRYLESAGVVGPYKNQHWTTSAVSKMIANRAYTGEARSGKHRLANAHPAIVTEAEWRAAQGVRGLSPLMNGNGDGALLAGLLRCAGCRYVMKPDSMRAASGEKLRLYRCRGDHAAGKCEAPASVLGRVVEPYVIERFFEALGPGGMLARPLPNAKAAERAGKDLEAAEVELQAWIEADITEFGRELYVAGLEVRQRRFDEARERLDVALGPTVALPAVADLGDLWGDLSVGERRQLLAAGIDAVMVRRGRDGIESRSLVLWHGEAPDDFPRRGRRGPLESFPWPNGDPIDAGISSA